MADSPPMISVLMAVYNGAEFLPEAIDSILNQTFQDFEFVIVDDCSSDNSVGIIQSYTDPRIRLILNETNLGLTKSLNKGILWCDGKYIARMDADDIACSERLDRQLKLMEGDGDLLASGSSVLTFGDDRNVWRMPVADQYIRATLLFNNPINHPTAIFRSELMLKEGLSYNEKFINSQDYDLWYQISKRGKLANIDEPLLHYRLHKNQTLKQPQLEYANLVREEIFSEALGIEPNVIPHAYFKIFDKSAGFTENDMNMLLDFFMLIETKNRETHFVDERVLGVVLLKIGKNIVDNAKGINSYVSFLFKCRLAYRFPEAVLDILRKKFPLTSLSKSL